MCILLNPFKSQLCVLSLIAFFLLFIPILTANEPATKPTSQEFTQKTSKLHMPFIANNGQLDGQVKFYAKTFGGTVFVTKEGVIVYALPANSSDLKVQGPECGGELHSPNGRYDKAGTLHNHHISDIVHPASWIVARDSKSEFNNNREDSLLRNPHYEADPKSAIKNDAVCHPECNEGSLVLKRDSSPSAQNDREELAIVRLTLRQAQDVMPCMVSGIEPSKTCGEQSRTIQNQKSGVALREEFVGSKVKAIQGEEPSVTKVSYFKGNDSSKWKTNISTYDAVNLGEIYDGIELKLRAYGNNVEKLFSVKPGANPEQIKIRLSGVKDCGVQNAEITHPLVPSREGINPKSDASTSLSMTSFRAESRNQNQKLQINKSGELEVETELGLVKFTKPVAYQEIEGKRVEVDVVYNISNPKSKTCGERSRTIRNPKLEYGFKVASYDRTKPLIIDPLLASTYLGGAGDDYGYSLALDTSGNVYVTGRTYSTDFPTTTGAYNTSYNGGDAFVSKLNGTLTTIYTSTFLGGDDNDFGNSIVIALSGNIYITGYTKSRNFPTTTGAYDISFNGDYYDYDIFVSELNAGLTSLLASTYLGGSDKDYANSIVIDSGENIYVAGRTESLDFPTTIGAYDTSIDYGVYSPGEVFVSKLNGNLTNLIASTYLGGSGDDTGNSLALDTSGNIYVTGYTGSLDFPTIADSRDTSFNGGKDVYVSKLNSNLTSLLASTYLGGSSYDYGFSIAIDSSGDVYVTGETGSTDFPTTSGAYDTASGYYDAFVSKLNSGLTSLLASTYLGGTGGDYGRSINLDTSGDVYVTGYTYYANFPTTSGAYDTSFNGGEDVFVSKLDGGLTSLLASTYLGGSYIDEGYAIDFDTSGNVYVTGWTSSTNFPTTSGAYDTSFGGNYDVFISKLDGDLSGPPPNGSIDINNGNTYTNATTVVLNLSATDDLGVVGYYISTSSTIPLSSASGWTAITSTISYSSNVSYILSSGDGDKTVYVWYKDIFENISSTTSDSIILDTASPIVTITSPTSDDTYSTTNSTIDLTGTASDSASGINSVTWSNDKGGSGVASGTTNWSISGISLTNGINTIMVKAIDGAGNYSTDTIMVTYTPIICDEATDIEAEPDLLILNVNKSDTVIVTVTGEDNCLVEGDTVRIKVYNPEIVRVFPRRQVTDENGEAVFTIKAKDKAGNAVVIFRDGSLSTQVPVRVVK